MSRLFPAYILLLLCSVASAQSLQIDYVQSYTLAPPPSYPYTNDQCIDLASGKLIAMSWGVPDRNVTPKYFLFELETGLPSDPAWKEYAHDRDETAEGWWAGFGVAAYDGKIYYYDNSTDPYGRMQMLEGIDDSQADAVTSPSTLNFTRNITIEGTGDNIWAATIGDGTEVRLLRATTPTLTQFDLAATLSATGISPSGMGRAGVGISPPPADGPPEFLLSTDMVYTQRRLRFFQHVGPEAEDYIHLDDIPEECADGKIDYCNPSGSEVPFVIALMRQRTGPIAAQVAMFQLQEGELVEVVRVDIPESEALFDIAERGSVEIDRENKVVYVTYTGTESPFEMNKLVIAKLSYEPPTVTPRPNVNGWVLQ